MLKIICDVKPERLKNIMHSLPSGNIAPAVEKHGVIIRYDNCQVCDLGNFKLTHTNKQNTVENVGEVLSMCNNNILSPVNPNYYTAYEDILKDSSDYFSSLKNMKFISIFETIPGFGTMEGMQSTQIFEAIIDITKPEQNNLSEGNTYTTGYLTHHIKYTFFDINTEDIIKGTANKNNDNQMYITREAASYILKHKGTLKCTQIEYKTEGSDHSYHKYYVDSTGNIQNENLVEYQEYMNFIEKSFSLNLQRQVSNARMCKLDDGKFANLITAGFGLDYKQAKILCKEQGGKAQSARDTLAMICAKHGDEHKLSPSDNFPIKCGNYKSYISFDEEGEILVTSLTKSYLENFQHEVSNVISNIKNALVNSFFTSLFVTLASRTICKTNSATSVLQGVAVAAASFIEEITKSDAPFVGNKPYIGALIGGSAKHIIAPDTYLVITAGKELAYTWYYQQEFFENSPTFGLMSGIAFSATVEKTGAVIGMKWSNYYHTTLGQLRSSVDEIAKALSSRESSEKVAKISFDHTGCNSKRVQKTTESLSHLKSEPATNINPIVNALKTPLGNIRDALHYQKLSISIYAKTLQDMLSLLDKFDPDSIKQHMTRMATNEKASPYVYNDWVDSLVKQSNNILVEYKEDLTQKVNIALRLAHNLPKLKFGPFQESSVKYGVSLGTSKFLSETLTDEILSDNPFVAIRLSAKHWLEILNSLELFKKDKYTISEEKEAYSPYSQCELAMFFEFNDDPGTAKALLDNFDGLVSRGWTTFLFGEPADSSYEKVINDLKQSIAYAKSMSITQGIIPHSNAFIESLEATLNLFLKINANDHLKMQNINLPGHENQNREIFMAEKVKKSCLDGNKKQIISVPIGATGNLVHVLQKLGFDIKSFSIWSTKGLCDTKQIDQAPPEQHYKCSIRNNDQNSKLSLEKSGLEDVTIIDLYKNQQLNTSKIIFDTLDANNPEQTDNLLHINTGAIIHQEL